MELVDDALRSVVRNVLTDIADPLGNVVNGNPTSITVPGGGSGQSPYGDAVRAESEAAQQGRALLVAHGLQRDHAVDDRIAGAIDDAHAAATDLGALAFERARLDDTVRATRRPWPSPMLPASSPAPRA